MKTSDFLKIIQENYTRARTMFLCRMAYDIGTERNEDSYLWEERMQSILHSHNISLSGNWHEEMEDDLTVPVIRDFHKFIRHLFLTLAIQHYQNLGD